MIYLVIMTDENEYELNDCFIDDSDTQINSAAKLLLQVGGKANIFVVWQLIFPLEYWFCFNLISSKIHELVLSILENSQFSNRGVG